MPTENTDDARILSPLSVLSNYPMGFVAYYGGLSAARDEILKVGALCMLLERQSINSRHWPDIVELSRHGAIRRRAFDFFIKNYEYEWAEKVAATEIEAETELQAARMKAELDLDSRGLFEAERALFLATGDISHIFNAADYAEELEGWRTAAETAVRAFLLRPAEMPSAGRLLHTLLFANKYDLVEQVCDTLDRLRILQPVARSYRATMLLRRGNPKDALKLLQGLPKDQLPKVLELDSLTARAEAYEKLGEYREAYRWYTRMNRTNHDKDIDAARFVKDVEGRGKLPVPELSGDTRDNCYMMLGFPRSGTTLLENALAAHPLIETFEEIPSMQSAYQYMGWQRLERGEGALHDRDVYEEARARYYREIDRRRRKSEATRLVDKMPIRSAEVKFLAKLFPEKKFIFSIRHPFDVVLSCFKQSFKPNSAMQNFLTIGDAAKLYDVVMHHWFEMHGMDDPKVHYVRYDSLVTDFENEIRRINAFLDVPWDDSVRDFAKAAETRKVQTPSYQKVRSGLSIGVQSSWKKYRFVFEGADAKPLYKWAEFFGYETS